MLRAGCRGSQAWKHWDAYARVVVLYPRGRARAHAVLQANAPQRVVVGGVQAHQGGAGRAWRRDHGRKNSEDKPPNHTHAVGCGRATW